MSDHKELDDLMKPLDIVPDEEAKQKAKALFLEKADKLYKNKGEKQKSTLRISKHNLYSFVAGMAAMLILVIGISSAVNPEFLKGTLVDQKKIIRYRMFPAEIKTPDISTADRYLAEMAILPTPRNNLTVNDTFSICDGSQMVINDNPALFAILGSGYGFDYSKFRIPDFADKLPVSNFSYYLANSVLFSSSGESKGKILTNDIAYIPCDITHELKDYTQSDSLIIGELMLIKANDDSSLTGKLIPCEGQTLSVTDYPYLAAVLGVQTGQITLPDMSSLSPVEGAEYYISNIGGFMYYDPEYPPVPGQ